MLQGSLARITGGAADGGDREFERVGGATIPLLEAYAACAAADSDGALRTRPIYLCYAVSAICAMLCLRCILSLAPARTV